MGRLSLERALFLARCLGGFLLIAIGPLAVNGADPWVFYGFGMYFIAYAVVTLWVSERATTPGERRRAEWIAHVFDTFGFIGGLLISAVDDAWMVTNAAPLYIVIVAFRFGAGGAAFAVGAISVAHVAIAQWRTTLGFPMDVADTAVHIGIYVLAGLITAGIEGEMRALRARREMSEAVYEPLLQAHDDMKQGVLITEDERAVYVSDGFIALTGRTREEVMGLSSVFELINEDERQAIRDLTNSLPDSGGMLQKAIVHKDGHPIHVEVALRRYDHDGKTRTVSIVRDITVRTRALAELERTQRLESLGSLAGGIAHDFNNLLAVILNNAHIALDSSGVSVKREIEEIQHAAERGAQLTRQLLVFSRGGTTAGERVDISREVASAERLLRRTIGADVALEVRLAPGLPTVQLGPGQVEQILMNLAVNARDAMPAGGRLTIAVDAVDLDSTAVAGMHPLRAGRQVRIVVHDTGTGMTPEVSTRAFEPFFTTKAKGRGTGLGLSSVYGMVTRAGGHIGIASDLGSGTRISIHLPAVAAERPAPDAPAPRQTEEGVGLTILVVDDDQSLLRSTSLVLRSAGYKVVEAATPSEALLAATRHFDMLVTDVVLPGISGRELAKRIREHHPAMPVLLTSGYSPEGGRLEDAEFLAKPFTPEALLARVREGLRSTRSLVGVS